MSTPVCLFCGSYKYRDAWPESTFYNGKWFHYVQCRTCKLVYVHPSPDKEDYAAMYPVTYQSPIVTDVEHTYQWLWPLIGSVAPTCTLLDYGCGSGRFVKEALQKGYTVTGVEFGQTMVSRLAEAFPKATFYTIDEFQQHSDGVFDVVFLSNVLEHLTTPKEVLAFLVKKLKPGGLLVAEGPLEANRSIANFFRRVAFRMRKSLLGKTATHAPTHVFQANRHNQLQLFQQSGLVTQKLFLQEQPWPFPYSWSKGDAPSRLLLVVVARISVALGPLIPGSGNTFVYIGSKPLH